MNQKEEIFKFLQKERSSARSIQHEMNEDVGSKQIMIINQKREFFWRVATIALGLSGGVTFFYDKTLHKEYFFSSLILFSLVVVYAIFWTREVLDHDGNNLQKWQDKYNIAIEEKIKFVDKFTVEISDKNEQEDFLSKYFEEAKKLPSIPLLNADVEELENTRKNRDKQTLDYSGECIVFLFMCGVLFLIFSLIHFKINWLLASFSVLLIFGLAFSDNFLKAVNRISRIATTLNKIRIFSRAKNN